MLVESKTGNRLTGVYRGQVLKHLPHGRCKIYIPGVYNEEYITHPDMLPDAEQASPLFAGTNTGNGVFSYPNIGSIVWCLFANDDQNYPVYFAATLGGENAFGQYEIVMPPRHRLKENGQEEDLSNIISTDIQSNKHLITSGHSQIEIYESGKISAYVSDPQRRQANVNYNNAYQLERQNDHVTQRPILEQVENEVISSINAQIVADNHDNYGEISSSTHHYDINSDSTSEFLSTVLQQIDTTTDYMLTVDTKRVQHNNGLIKDNQISTGVYSDTYSNQDLLNLTWTNASLDKNTNISTETYQCLDGTIGNSLSTDQIIENEYKKVDVENQTQYSNSENTHITKSANKTYSLFNEKISQNQRDQTNHEFSDTAIDAQNFIITTRSQIDSINHSDIESIDDKSNRSVVGNKKTTYNDSVTYNSFHSDLSKPKVTLISSFSNSDLSTCTKLDGINQHSESYTYSYSEEDNHNRTEMDSSNATQVIELSSRQNENQVNFSVIDSDLGISEKKYSASIHTLNDEKTHVNLQAGEFYIEKTEETNTPTFIDSVNAGSNFTRKVEYSSNKTHDLTSCSDQSLSPDQIINDLTTITNESYNYNDFTTGKTAISHSKSIIEDHNLITLQTETIYKEDSTYNGKSEVTTDNTFEYSTNSSVDNSLTTIAPGNSSIEKHKKTYNNAITGSQTGLVVNSTAFKKDEFDGSISNQQEHTINAELITDDKVVKTTELSEKVIKKDKTTIDCKLNYTDSADESFFEQAITDSIAKCSTDVKVDAKNKSITIKIENTDVENKSSSVLTMDAGGNINIIGDAKFNINIGNGTSTFMMNNDGTINIGNGTTSFTMNNDGTIAIKGDVAITGKLVVTNDIISEYGDVTASKGYTLNTHKHPYSWTEDKGNSVTDVGKSK